MPAVRSGQLKSSTEKAYVLQSHGLMHPGQAIHMRKMKPDLVMFYERQVGEWGTIALVLIFFHWMLPFAGLMSRHIRRNPKLVLNTTQ